MIRAALLLTIALAAMPAAAIEEPRFETLRQAGNFELRLYAPMIVAETIVRGDLARASNDGFRAIAGYIFGDNVSARGAGSEKVAMTAPVTMEAASEKIAMTVPVTMEAGATEGYRMHFVMPSAYTLETLPRPRDDRRSTHVGRRQERVDVELRQDASDRTFQGRTFRGHGAGAFKRCVDQTNLLIATQAGWPSSGIQCY